MNLKALLEGRGVLVLDGAMGTELDRRGCAGRCDSNLDSPRAVREVHAAYAQAGSTAMITNTLTASRLFIESHGLNVDPEAINRVGARLARAVVGSAGCVLGNLSSTGQLLEPYGTCSEQALIATFEEQARYLAEEGVDGFIIETIIDLQEAICALRACKAISSLPTIACMAFSTTANGGRTPMGNSAEDCARRLTEEGADALGANCGTISPEEMAEIIATMSSFTRLPLAAEPNAGKPRLLQGKTVFDMAPDPFAAGVLKCRDAGATLLGGCCGTTPEHIHALSQKVTVEGRASNG